MYAAQGLNYLFPLLVLPILARRLGVAPFGELVFAQAVSLYAVILAEYGFNFTATREIAAAASSQASVARLFWTTLTARVLLACIGTALTIAIVAAASSREFVALVAACLLQAIGTALMPVWYLQGLQRFLALALAQASGRATSMVLLFVLVQSGEDVIWAAAIIALAPFVSAVAALSYVGTRASVTRYRPRARDIFESLRTGGHMFQANLAGSLYLNTNVLILGWVTNSYVVGLYGFGSRVVTALVGLVAPIAQVALPALAVPGAAKRTAEFIRRARPFALAILAVGVGGTASLALFPGLVSTLVGGDRFSDAASILRVMSPLPAVLALSTVFAHLVMIGFGLYDKLRRIYWVMALTSLVCFPLAASWGGAVGASFVWIAVELLGLVLMAHAFKSIQSSFVRRLFIGGARVK